MTEEFAKARELLAAGDSLACCGTCARDGEALPLEEVARLVAGAARLPGSVTWRRPPRR